VFTHRPGAKFLVPFVSGILIGWYVPVPLWFVIPVMSVLLFLFTANILCKRPESNSITCLLAFSLILWFGMFKVTADRRISPYASVERFVRQNKELTLLGTISEYPKRNEQSLQFTIDAESVFVGNIQYKAEGGVVASLRLKDIDSTLLDSLAYGRKIAISGHLAPLAGARNPGESDLKQYYQSNNIYARFEYDRWTLIQLGPRQRNFLSTVVYPIRAEISHRFEQFVGGEEAAFLKGLIIGDRSEITPELKDAFVNAGVMHIIAVAGLHVGMVSLIFLSLFTALRIPNRARIILLSLFLVFFLFLTGSAHPVIRAVIMAMVLIGGMLWERKTDVYNSLAVAAIVLLLLDARNLFQAGFQLSFSSVFFIVHLHPKCISLFDRLPDRIRKRRILKYIVELVAVSFSAAIGTLPFSSIYFGKISFIGLVANLVIVPVTGVVLALGVTTVLASIASAWLGFVYGATAKLFSGFLLKAVSFFGNLSFSYVDSHFSFWSALVFYGVVIGFANAENKALVKRLIILLLAIANILMFESALVQDAHRGTLRVTFLDVGQGDAIFMQFPNGKNLLLDAGPRTLAVDAGQRFIGPFLKWQGIRRLDAIAMSHSDEDHIGGVPYLLRNFTVERTIDGGTFSNSFLSKECLHLIDSLHIVRDVESGGKTLTGFGNARLYVVNPVTTPDLSEDGALASSNNKCLVLKLVYGQSSMLLTGDAEVPAEARMVDAYDRFLSSDVIKSGHHGSISSSSTEFLRTVQPKVAIISVGRNNKFGHPSPVVLERLKLQGCHYLRTDEVGAVAMESDGARWSLVDWR